MNITHTKTSRLVKYLWHHIIALEVVCTIVVILSGMWCIHHFEWFSLYNSLYYTIITISWVWYGDITPITQEGRMVAMVLASVGLPLYLITATIIATSVVNGMKKVRKSHEKVIISKVKALIIEDQKVLLLKTENQLYTIWDLPWGTIQYGENAEHALSRRVIQEIQQPINIKKSIGIWWWINKRTGAFSLCHTYLAHLQWMNQNLFIDEKKKSELVCWVSLKDIVENKVDIENDSLIALIKEQYIHLV